MIVPLLQTKLYIPRPQPGLVHRERLIKRLDEGLKGKLILVSAPAGFGKTSLLGEWLAFSKHKITWLSLDQSDRDPTRFWTYFIAALQKLRENLGEHALALLREQGQLRPATEYFLTLLLNEIAAFPDDFVFILDDYHIIDTPEINEGLTFLLDHVSSQMHLILTGRSDPPLPLAHWRARNQLAEIRADDLCFTSEEAATLLNQRMGLNLSPGDIAALEMRTEGWIVGLQLAALSMQGRTDITEFITTFTGSNHYIVDYLTEEVLQRQSESVRSFLRHTCVLDQLCDSLCEAVTEHGGNQDMLEHLEQANLFTISLDDNRQWYRYHHLLAEMLRNRLQHTHPERIPDLHRRAGEWYEHNGFTHDAVRHALAAGESVWAARMVERHVEEILRRGEGETLRGWLTALPQELVRSRPRLALAQVIAAFNTGHIQAAEPLLKDAEQALAATALSEPYEPSIGKGMSMLANVPASIALLRASLAANRGDAERTTELVRWAQAHMAEDEQGPRISVRWNLAQADWIRGRLSEAEHAFAGIVAEGRETGEPHLTLTAGSVLGRIQRAQGRLEAAFRTYQEGLEFAARTGPTVVLSAAAPHVGMAELFYERNQLEQALRHAGEGISLGRQLTSTQSLATGLATLAWIRKAMEDPAGAQEAMDEAYQVMPNLEIVALHNPVPAERARLLLAQGDVKEVARWVEERGLKEEDEPGYARELEYLVLARYLLSRNMTERTLALLEPLGAAAKAQARMGSVIEIQVLQTLGFQAAGKADQAMKVLAETLLQAEPEGYIRTFVDEGGPMAALLHRALSRGVTPDYTSRLLASFPSIGRGVEVSLYPVTFSFNESLSERELEVLRLLASGASNQEIAEELSIALTTARKHVSNIISKLGVNNRTQAVSRGRDLGLL